MKISCQRCNPNEAFYVPNFSEKEKQKLQHLNSSSPLHAVKEIKDSHNISHKDAKFIISHLNKQYNTCHRCEKSLNGHEYTTCTICGSLNFNWNV